MPGVLARPTWAQHRRGPDTSRRRRRRLLVDFLTTGAIRHAVNMTNSIRKSWPLSAIIWISGYRLGLLMAQIDRTRQRPADCNIVAKWPEKTRS